MSWLRRLFGLAPKPAAGLKAWKLMDEVAAKTRVEIDELHAYVQAIEGAFKDYFSTLPAAAPRDMVLQGTIRPEGKADLPISVPMDGFMDQNVLAALYTQLFALPVPKVKDGSVEFVAVFALWGGSPSRPFGV